jgi:nucleoside 2-deoxyribosyltransferase
MKVYLAARFSRLEELLGYKAELRRLGIEVTSRWLLGGHEWVGTADEEIPVEELARFAADDIADLEEADVLICFTESPRSGPARGGRHVEFGYALAIGKPTIVVGHRENVFYCLPGIQFAETWEKARRKIRSIADERGRKVAQERLASLNRAFSRRTP